MNLSYITFLVSQSVAVKVSLLPVTLRNFRFSIEHFKINPESYDPISGLQIGGALRYMDLMKELQDNLGRSSN